MSTATVIDRLSPADYLDREREAEQRHEFLDGEVVAMAGGSRARNLLGDKISTYHKKPAWVRWLSR